MNEEGQSEDTSELREEKSELWKTESIHLLRYRNKTVNLRDLLYVK